MDGDLLSPGDIERRAAAIGLSLKSLFERARISHTTFYRWKAGKTAPNLDVYRRIRDALEAAAAEAA